MSLNLPWNNYADIELAGNELVSQFSMNRCLRRLLDNDYSFTTLLENTTALEYATDAQAASGVITTAAITPKQLHFADTKYIELSGGTTDLIKTAPGTYTYNISDFRGDGLDETNTGEIRGLWVYAFAFAGDWHQSKINAQFPYDADATTTICESFGINSDDDCGNGVTTFIPIKKGQTSIKFILSGADAGYIKLQIKGAQIRTFEEPDYFET